MQQVASNLIGNALTHGAADNPIKVTARVNEGNLVFEVWNTGDPIPAGTLAKVFEPFWRRENPTNRDGLGLGLHICSQILRAHRGQLSVKSSTESGTTFTAHIPYRWKHSLRSGKESGQTFLSSRAGTFADDKGRVEGLAAPHRSTGVTRARAFAPCGIFLTLFSIGIDAAAPVSTAIAVPDAPTDAGPVIDQYMGERSYPNEESIAESLSGAIEETIRKQYSAGGARRGAHPKAHGCVQADIQVLDTIPTHLAKGIFIPGKTYRAWIRFSNGSADPTRADIQRDARGIAIKVLDVPGTKLLEDEENGSTQDFIMINHPVFFATDPARYLKFMNDANSNHFYRKLLIPFDLGAKGTRIAVETRSSRIANPLDTRYWSMVPYQLGIGSERQAVKFSVRACSASAVALPQHPAHDFLRDALRDTLKDGDACMEFLVQPRTWRRFEFRNKYSIPVSKMSFARTSPSARGTRFPITVRWESPTGCERSFKTISVA